MNTASMEEKFSEIVEKNSDSIYESCKKCVDLLEGWGREAQEGFQYFLTQVPLPQYAPGEVPKGFIQIREEEVDAPTQKRIREMESQIVKELILQDVTEKKFYQELWKRFCDTLLISDRYQRAYFLLRTWLDPRIPYYRLGLGLRMDDETFQACVQQVELPFKKTRFAMNAGYPQKTQKASILMEIADAIPDQKQRVVFWALTLGRLEKEIVDLRRQVKALKACRAPTDPDGA